METVSIAATCLLSIALIWGEHYTPWNVWLKRPLKQVEAYILGTLAIICPVTGLLIFWINWRPFPGDPYIWAIIALWTDVIVSGITTMIFHFVDYTHDTEQRANMAEAEKQVWRDESATREN